MTKPSHIVPAASLPVGSAIEINGQRYDLVRHEDYVRQDGAITVLSVWHAECAECGVGFSCRSAPKRWPEQRRCDLHKAPGRRAGK